MQIEVKNSSSQTIGQYWYDGAGKRVRKYVPSTGENTIFVYDVAGRTIAECSTIVESASTAKVSYLTEDHLGSPRLNTDANGAVIARHDYHPFGSEIATSQRTYGLGFNSDTVRKKFTGYERDAEITLDFAQARYYQNEHGRFNSPDKLLSTGRPDMPQSWNKFTYVMNNPLAFVDPTGLYICNLSAENCGKVRKAVQQARDDLEKIREQEGETSTHYKEAKEALDTLGAENVDNGITIELCNKKNPCTVGHTDVKGRSERKEKTDENPTGRNIIIRFTQAILDDSMLEYTVVHESSHAADATNWTACNYCKDKNPTNYQTEFKAYKLMSVFARANDIGIGADYQPDGLKGEPPPKWRVTLWDTSWTDIDSVDPHIDHFLKHEEPYKSTLNLKAFGRKVKK
jgi:RHS repeat-associated protein